MPSGSQWLADFQAMGDRTLPTSLNKVAVAGTALANANDAIAQVKGIAPPASGGGGGQLGNQLATAAALILGGVPCQTYVAGFSGWDTHGGEPYTEWDATEGE